MTPDYESGTLYTGQSGTSCPIRIRYSYKQYYSLNKTTITATLEQYRASGYSSNKDTASKKIYQDGATKGTATGFNLQRQSVGTWADSRDWNGNNPFTISWDIPHNSDGSKIISLGASLDASGTSLGYLSFTTNNIVLHQIPRGSIINSITNAKIGESIDINLQGYLDTFIEHISFSLNNTDWTLIETRQAIIGTNIYQYTLPDSLYAEIPTKTKTGYIRVQTFNENDEQVGNDSIAEFTITAESTPTISNVSIQDINTITRALTGSDNIIVGRYSNMKIGASASSNHYATISSLKVNGLDIVNGYATIENCNTNQIKITAVDSRGYTAEYTIPNLTLKAYAEPTNNILITRNTPTDGIVNFTGNGNYWNQNFGSQNNTLQIRYKYKKQKEQNYSNWETITPTISGNTYQVNQQKSTINYEYVYNFVIEVIDKLTTLSREYIVIKGKPIFYIKEDGIYDGATDEPYIHGQGGGSGEFTPIGTISQWGTDTAPDGWLICDGSAISRTAYNELFAIIGTTYGAGDGTTTFNLPDLRDKVPQGAGEIGDVGDSIDAGLPNIEGGWTTTWNSNVRGFHGLTTSGAFVRHTDTSRPGRITAEDTSANNSPINGYPWLDASVYNPIYGNSDTVQPNATIVCFIIKYAQVSTEPLPSEAGIPVGSILEFNGTEDQIPVGYAKYEDGGEIYSTDEVKIGTWIDGKPLYRKVFTFNTGLSNGSILTIPSGISNMETLMKIEGSIYNNNSSFSSGGLCYHLPFYSAPGETSSYVGLRMSGTNIQLLANGGWNTNWTKVIILEYTKTTD